MTDYGTIIPTTGCLEASWTSVRPDGSGKDLTVHHPVFGLLGDLTLIIEMHGRQATSADLDNWLIQSGDQGRV